MRSRSFTDLSKSDCDSIEATAKIKNPDLGKENGEITVDARGGEGRLRYFFFNEKGYPLNSNKEEMNLIRSLSEGTYKCSVADEAGCIKQLIIELR